MLKNRSQEMKLIRMDLTLWNPILDVNFLFQESMAKNIMFFFLFVKNV